MANFLFCSAPLPGHLDFGGFLQTASFLNSKGHDVIWASGREVSGLIRKTGIPFIEATVMKHHPASQFTEDENDMTKLQYIAYRTRRSMDIWFDAAQVTKFVKSMIKVCQEHNIQVIVAENCAAAAGILSEILNIPLAIVGYPYGALRQIPDVPETKEVFGNYYERLNSLRKEFNLHSLSPDRARWMFFYSHHLHLTFFPHEWWYRNTDAIPVQARFLGGKAQNSANPVISDWLDSTFKGRRVVFLTLGTAYTKDGYLMHKLIEAVVEELGYGCIIAGAIHHRQIFNKLPVLAKWFEWIDYSSILPLVDMIIHHGGMGTTHASILSGLPQLIIPRFSVQFHHASKVEKFGLGICIKPRFQKFDLRNITESIENVLTPNFQRKNLEIQNKFSQLGGVESAASLLLQLANKTLKPTTDHLPDLPTACNDYRYYLSLD